MKSAYGVDLPENLRELLDRKRCALIVYDMQAGIIQQVEHGAAITERVKEALQLARAAGMRVFHTRHLSLPKQLMGAFQFRQAMLWQRTDDPEKVEPWFLRDSPAFQIVPELQPLANEAVFDKLTMSAFEGTPLNLALRDCGIQCFLIVGVAMEIGIDITCRHGADLGFIPIVVRDACGAGHQDAAERALQTLAFLGDTVLTDMAIVRASLACGRVMKKFINRADDVVEEMLQGLIVLQPNTARIAGHKVLIRSDATKVRDRRVAVISGGGSGHEPAHAGYVGEGMLSAAVLGEVFTSPSSDSVFAAIKAVSGKKGAVLVVKNYTGDRLNFGLAAEMARAEGIPVEMVIVDDDVALKGGAQQTSARGLAGTVFVHKLVGAAACEGGNLAEVASVGKAAVQALATMGVSLSAGTAPAVGRPSFELGDHEMELGLGIHGEPGAQRTELRSADELSENLLTEIIKYGKFGQEKRVAVMLNNLGSTTAMELAIVARRVVPFLGDRGFKVERIYTGTFLSSLDMAGISISVLGLTDQRLRWLDSGTAAPAWPNVLKQGPGRKEETIAAAAGTATSETVRGGFEIRSG